MPVHLGSTLTCTRQQPQPRLDTHEVPKLGGVRCEQMAPHSYKPTHEHSARYRQHEWHGRQGYNACLQSSGNTEPIHAALSAYHQEIVEHAADDVKAVVGHAEHVQVASAQPERLHAMYTAAVSANLTMRDVGSLRRRLHHVLL